MDKIHIGSRRGEMSCVVWHTKSENRYVNYNKSDLCVEILKNEYITEWVIDMSSKIKIALAVVIVIMLGINVAIILHGVPKNNPVVKQQKLSQNSIFINQQQVLQKEKRSFQVVSLANESSNQTQATTTRQSTPTSGSNGGTVGVSDTKLPPKFDILPNVNVSSVPQWAQRGALIAGSYDLGWSMCIVATTQDASKQVLQVDWSGKFATQCSGVPATGFPSDQVYSDNAVVTISTSSTPLTLPTTWYTVTITMTGVGPNGNTIGLTRIDHVETLYTTLGPIVVGMSYGAAEPFTP